MRRPPVAENITSKRLVLTPLQVVDADEIVRVLGDERLHEFIGGTPATLRQLRQRYRHLLAGSGRSDEAWLNWIVRLRPDGDAVGTVQATVTSATAGVASGPGPGDGTPAAEVAWVVGVPWQGRGIAAEAARALVDWLRTQGIDRISAHVRPDHAASGAVAARAGLGPTGDIVDGETVWRLPEGGDG